MNDDDYNEYLKHAKVNQQVAQLLQIYRQRGILTDSDLKKLSDLIWKSFFLIILWNAETIIGFFHEELPIIFLIQFIFERKTD